jgi:hypothetical protein
MMSFVGLFFLVGVSVLSVHGQAPGPVENNQTGPANYTPALLLLHPYVVKVSYAPLSPYVLPIRCTGAIYNKLWIVTSARCALPTLEMLKNKPTHDYGDINGGDDEPLSTCKPSDLAKVRYVVDAKLPPEAMAALKNNGSLDDFDISLLKVNKPFIYSKTIKAIRMPQNPKDCDEKSEAFIMGFGKAGDNDTKWVRKLRRIDVKIASEDDSKAADPKFTKEFRIVTKSKGEDSTCGSDLGAPQVNSVKINLKQAPVDIYYPFLCGVLRRTHCEDKEAGRPAGIEFFAKVLKWIGWIRKTGGVQDKFD